MADSVLRAYPQLHVLVNPDWQTSGPTGSLARAPLRSRVGTYVSYADIVFRSRCVERLEASNADLTLAVDRQWRTRFEARREEDIVQAEKVDIASDAVRDIGSHVAPDDADAEFIGLARFSPHAVEAIESILSQGTLGQDAALPELLRLLLSRSVSAAVVDVAGDWAELNAPQDLARFVLGTKAESLERLQPLVRKSEVPQIVAFDQATWRSAPDSVLDRVRGEVSSTEIIVRSSARSEDTWERSNAGAFLSIAEVPTTDRERVTTAVEAVIDSYGQPRGDDQILIQPMLQEVASSGVVMTRTPGTGAPYYVISFDSTTSRTDTVTGGTGEGVRTIYLLRGTPLRADLCPEMAQVLECVLEVEELVGHDYLDIEFAVGRDGTVYLLQVRPIALSNRVLPIDEGLLRADLDRAADVLRAWKKASPNLLGERNAWSVMADWNPAEMIGTKPSPLAHSLYRRLVTDEVWAASRAELGFRDVRPCPLLIDVLGQPYVDVRADFNSFLPASLEGGLGGRLVDHFVSRLEEHPELHDKIEFEIVPTCVSFDFRERAKDLMASGFTAAEVESLEMGLVQTTRATIDRAPRDLASFDELGVRFRRVLSSGAVPLDRVCALVDDGRRIGFPAFANLARGAFVATAMLRSLERCGVLAKNELEAFLASLETVSGRMQRDGAAVAENRMSWEDFVATYGHLRPGTYDIQSPCYSADPESYLRPFVRAAAGTAPPKPAGLSADAKARIEQRLPELDLGIGAEEFEHFAKTVIEGRELGKFLITRNVSAILEELANFGDQHRTPRNEMSLVPIDELEAMRAKVGIDVAAHLSKLVDDGREVALRSQAIHLPAQILSPEELHCFEHARSEPNFVTRKRVAGEVCLVAADHSRTNPEGMIVAIPSADPGYDWLFSRPLAGLITMYGGANSHMAVRAAEFQLPAAIGVGETVFGRLENAQLVELDCGARQIRFLR